MGVKDSLLSKLLGNADKFSDEQVMQTVSLLLDRGVTLHATDIHIEPHERSAVIRYRVHGVLRQGYKLPLSALPIAVSQIKNLAHLDMGIVNMPQEGHYSTLADGQELEIVVNTLPVVGGEKVVLHINRQLTVPPKLEQLGFYGRNLSAVESALARPSGLILVAAPRKSGKSTLSGSMLKLLLSPTNSIATIESSIDFRLPGASQTRIRPHTGITHYSALKAVLGQDANVILINDLPDRQTVDLAIHAAASGHLVIAGVASNNAITGLHHVQSFANEPVLLAHSLRAVVGCQLVRILCRQCRQPYEVTAADQQQILKTFGLKQTDIKKLHEHETAAKSDGLGGQTSLGSTPTELKTLWRADEDGCRECNQTGFIGAYLMNEVLVPSDQLQTDILSDTSVSTLHSHALKNGFVPKAVDGLVKALRGETTIDEVICATLTS